MPGLGVFAIAVNSVFLKGGNGHLRVTICYALPIRKFGMDKYYQQKKFHYQICKKKFRTELWR